MENKKKAIVYSRCSTDEKKQDVQVQVVELERYCKAYNWQYEIISEYGSGYKGEQPKLKELLERIRKKEFDVLLVYSLDRFSREHPAKVNALLDRIVYQYKCRFIALLDNIDSNNEMSWLVMKNLFTYFAHIYSRNLSEKVKAGIKRKKEKREYSGGRPQKKIDIEKLKRLYEQNKSLRKTADAYNQGLGKRERISYVLVKKTLNNLNEENVTKNSS